MNYPITVSNGNKVVEVSGDEYKVRLVIERDGIKFYYAVYNNSHLLTVERLSKYLHLPSSNGGEDRSAVVGVVNHVRNLLGAATDDDEFLEIEEITLDAEPLALGGWYEVKGGSMTVKADGESWRVTVDDMIVSDTDMLLRKLQQRAAVMLLMASAIRGDFSAGNDYRLEFSQTSKDKVLAALRKCEEETTAVYLKGVMSNERSFTSDGIESCEVSVVYQRTESTPAFTTVVGYTPFNDLQTFKNTVRGHLADLIGDKIIFTADGDKLLADAYFKLGLDK